MHKNAILKLSAIIFGFALIVSGSSQSVYAIVECPNGQTAEALEYCPEPLNEEDDITPTSDEDAVVTSDEDNQDDQNSEGAGDQQPNDPSKEPPIEDDEEEAEAWPMYVAFGALGITLVLVIIINLLGRKKK